MIYDVIVIGAGSMGMDCPEVHFLKTKGSKARARTRKRFTYFKLYKIDSADIATFLF